jgi:nicotinamide-nucleotide amidase
LRKTKPAEELVEVQSLLPPEITADQEKDPLERSVGKLLKERKLTLSTAESCSGGYLAHLITRVPGASDYFIGSVIAYSNEVKMRQLGVREATLKEFGAVSEQTAKEMVIGALDLLKTDVALATTGIAGPDGGTPAKPVGTIWLAVGDKNRIETKRLQLGTDRLQNIQFTALYALDLLRSFLSN